MKILVIENYGPDEPFRLKEVLNPKPASHQILVRPTWFGLNPLDVKIKRGLLKGLGPPTPARLIGDFCGVIEEKGTGVSGELNPGDTVFGWCGGLKHLSGSLGDLLVCDGNAVAHKPPELTDSQAACLPLASITAWEAVFERAKLKAGQRALVLGGTGGVGHLVWQMCQAAGAEVVVACGSGEKCRMAENMGANLVYNYKEWSPQEILDRTNGGVGFEIVFDNAGGKSLDNALNLAGPGGRVVTIAARAVHDLTPLHVKGLELHAVIMLLPYLKNEGFGRSLKILKEVSTMVSRGQLRVLLDEKQFTTDTLNEAMEYLMSGNARGKIPIQNKISEN